MVTAAVFRFHRSFLPLRPPRLSRNPRRIASFFGRHSGRTGLATLGCAELGKLLSVSVLSWSRRHGSEL